MNTNNTNKVTHTKVNGYNKATVITMIGVETVENVIAKTQEDALFISNYTEKILLKASINDGVQKLNQDALKN